MGVQYSLVAAAKNFDLFALQHSWILATDDPLTGGPFKDIKQGDKFLAIGEGGRTSAGFPRLVAASGWHYRFESFENLDFKVVGIEDPNSNHEMFIFSAHSSQGEDALSNWPLLLKRSHVYFCFYWSERFQVFGYSTVGCAGRMLEGNIRMLDGDLPCDDLSVQLKLF